MVNREFNPQKSSIFCYLTLFACTERLASTLVILPLPWTLWRTADFRGVASLVRLAPLHPHIMGDVICAWFGKKTVGRVVASYSKATDDDDDNNKRQSNRCEGGGGKNDEHNCYYY